jgi:hypothetical protein
MRFIGVFAEMSLRFMNHLGTVCIPSVDQRIDEANWVLKWTVFGYYAGHLLNLIRKQALFETCIFARVLIGIFKRKIALEFHECTLPMK